MNDDVRPGQLNLARDNATLVAVQHGDVYVHQRIGTHHIDELSFDAGPPVTDEQPSRLLNAGNQVVRFTGREREIADLAAWRDEAAAVAVRLVHGGAGQGKTRLAHRFAEMSHAAGWITLRARHSRDVAVRPIEVQHDEGALAAYSRVLVLVDYAERWPTSDLLALLLDRRLHGGPTLRVLLLARPIGNWWYALTHRLSEALGVRADTSELTPLGATHDDSRHVYRVASSCFAEALGVRDPGHPPAEVEGSVLTIHMAALAGVLATRQGDVPPTDPGALSAYLLDRERSHWQSMYDNDRRIQSTPRVMGRAVYLAALTRSLDYAAAVAALKATAVADDAGAAGQVLDDHAMCYPPHDSTTALEPLYPDRLAEDFVALQTPGHAVDGFRADPWANDAFAALVAASTRSAVTALPLLVETARRWPHLTERQLLPLLRERPDLAVHAGAPALSAIAAAPAMPLDVLEAIESALPTEPSGDLYAGIAAITERLATDLTGHTADPLRAARLSQKLGWRLLDAGQVPKGIALLTLAVDAARRLVADDRAGHAAQLELALRSLGTAHIRAEEWASAVTVLSEAIGLWTDPGVRAAPATAAVAGCLADLSLALWHQGHNASSLKTRGRAITQLRQLVATAPRHRLALIRALIQQADQLRQGDRGHDSLDALDEAVTLLRAVAADPDAGLESDFATTLLGRAKTLLSLGRLPEAEAAVAGAVKVFRRLAAVNIAYDGDLARALLVEAEVLGRLERWPDAIDTQDQAAAIYRRLARISMPRHAVDLARTLVTFARLCRDAGHRHEDALTRLREAMTILKVGRLDPAVQQRLTDAARWIGADLLDATGRHDEADDLRRSPHHYSPPPQPSQRRPPRPPDTSQRDLARSMAGSIHYLARAELERLEPLDAAAVLAALKEVRFWWLEAILRGLHRDHELEVLRLLVRHEAHDVDTVTWRVVAKRLLTLSAREAAAILSDTTPATAAAILNYDDWSWKARAVLAHLDHAVEITRRLGYDPYADQAKKRLWDPG
ncbi:tetratricopeptide repeat protein [Phytohabitans rumicis]|uniref:Uncharacterized protein n=1 Tax=Phytohabitans rumicis TaxID=1076125 RepID=A0A6V8LSW6_9ACTN|nr:tetratricopeptide repeat protein [Phytohabitans rumicis]GFJ95845.1 hypothetical protein Prum_094870 [Phytohabitans rumicis]